MSEQLELDLMQKGLHDRVIELNAEVSKLSEELIHLQDICTHPAETLYRKGNSNTGNYCPGDDKYWYDFHCKCCGRRWTTPQDRANGMIPCNKVGRY